MKPHLRLSRMVLIALIIEATEFGDLEDTRENIRGRRHWLSPEGQLIYDELLKNGIDTPEKVDQFFNDYLLPLLGDPILNPYENK